MKLCAVTVYVDPLGTIGPRGRGTGDRFVASPCGAPVSRYGLCAEHAADRDRLGGEREPVRPISQPEPRPVALKRTAVLTTKGWIAAICASAEPFVWPDRAP